MNRKVYFSGSISGGRSDANFYARIIEHIKQTDVVLTEHIGDQNYAYTGRTLAGEQAIYAQDTAWLRECDLVIAECTVPSLGVGYELAYAESIGKPVYVFYRPSAGIHLSAMICGNPYFKVIEYEDIEQVLTLISNILSADNN